MPDHGCGVKGLCLHTIANSIDDGTDVEFVEVDPCGRYGRYEEVLGKGAFKTVYRAFDRADGIEVAWNQVKVKDVLRTPEDLERLYSEVHLLRTLNHKNIIKFYHSWMDMKTKSVNFITEIFTSGTLRQYRKRHKHVDMKALKNWSRQILRGLHYLHSHDPPVIHRDLKCDNIFVNGNQGEVKIGDLGLATILLRARAAHSVIGTPEFMAPELYEEEYNELVDIYSFGMCLLELVTFEYPYSECTNAAQIYKKVISGKKPEALSKVTDPELREFINKCLVTASKRLSARELLMDPFLRRDGDGNAVEALSHIKWAITDTDYMDDLGVSGEESAAKNISHRRKDMSPSFYESNICSISPLPPLVAGDEFKSLPRTHMEEESIGRGVEFRVKGKRREDDTVYLCLRIADSEGQVRNIHFPFDIEGDTAMSVATEMVTELDFTDQDVTKIAEMIDAAILALVPEWNPGVAIDETCSVAINRCFPDEEEVSFDCHDIVSTADNYSKLHDILNPLSVMSSENSHVGQHMLQPYETPGLVVSDLTTSPHVEGTMHGRFEEVTYHRPSTFSTSSGIGTVDGAVPVQMEGTMHGRFEEVTYHCHRDSFTEEGNCSMSTCSSDILKELGHWDAVEEQTSHGSCGSHDSLPKSGFTEDCLSFENGNRISQSVDVGAAFNELDATIGFVSYAYQSWEGLFPREPCHDHSASSAGLVKGEPFVQDIVSEGAHQALSAPSSLSLLRSLDDDDKLVVQELRVLAQRHEQERRALQHKHEAALLELRNKWQQKRSSRILSVSTGTHQCRSTVRGSGDGHGMQVDGLHEIQLNDYQQFVSKQATSKFHRISSGSDLKK